METKNLKIYVTEKETKDESGKTKKFNVYHTFSKNGRKMQVKFRQDVTGIPKENFTAVVSIDDMNIDKSSQYLTLWIKNVLEFADFITEEDKENKKKQLEEFF